MSDAERIAALEARVRELEDADKEVDQLRADNREVRAKRDALRERVRELEAAIDGLVELPNWDYRSGSWTVVGQALRNLAAVRKGARP